MRSNIDYLVGKKIVEVRNLRENANEVIFVLEGGEELVQYHAQDCCEMVAVRQVDGDVADIVGHTVRVAEEREVHDHVVYDELNKSTFYAIRTDGGDLDWRWDGSSNGYYSVSVYHRIHRASDWEKAARSASAFNQFEEHDYDW